MWIAIEIGIGVYCAFVGGLFAFQRRLMYFPAKMTAPPSAFGLKGVEDIFLETSDKVRLQTWVHAARPGYPTLLYFHGNALIWVSARLGSARISMPDSALWR
jgi:uncharacterized protein